MGVKRFDFIEDDGGEGWIEEAVLGKYILAFDYDALESSLQSVQAELDGTKSMLATADANRAAAHDVFSTVHARCERLQAELDILKLSAKQANEACEKMHATWEPLVHRCERIEAELANVLQANQTHCGMLSEQGVKLRDAEARCERLEAELAEVKADYLRRHNDAVDRYLRIVALEAALREIAEECHPENYHNIGCGFHMQKIARAVLATAETEAKHG